MALVPTYHLFNSHLIILGRPLPPTHLTNTRPAGRVPAQTAPLTDAEILQRRAPTLAEHLSRLAGPIALGELNPAGSP